MMQIQYLEIQELPKLAWLAKYDVGRHRLTVSHGSGVETAETFFVEGVWDGDFAKGNFANKGCFFGSGMTFEKQKASFCFVPSAATTDSIYYKFIPEKLFQVANSLPLLLASVGDNLDDCCSTYDKIDLSITDGIYSYIKEIPTKSGVVNRLLYHNMIFDGEDISFVEKEMPEHFSNYTEYELFLKNKYKLIVKNARDVGRENKPNQEGMIQLRLTQ